MQCAGDRIDIYFKSNGNRTKLFCLPFDHQRKSFDTFFFERKQKNNNNSGSWEKKKWNWFKSQLNCNQFTNVSSAGKKRMNKFSVWKFNPQPRRIAISMGKTTNILITDECRTHTFDFTVNNNETAARDSDRTVKQMKKKLSKFCYERSNAKYVFLSIS